MISCQQIPPRVQPCTVINPCNPCSQKCAVINPCPVQCNPCQPVCNPCPQKCIVKTCQTICNPCNPCNPCQPTTKVCTLKCKTICPSTCKPTKCESPCQPIKCKPKCEQNNCSDVFLTTNASGSQIIPSGISMFPYTIITVWSQNAIINSNNILYNPVNGQFTIPISGWYSINVNGTWDINSTGNRGIWLVRKNNCGVESIIASDTRPAATSLPTNISLTTTVFLNACDIIFVSVFQDSGVPLQFFLNVPIAPNIFPNNSITVKKLCQC